MAEKLTVADIDAVERRMLDSLEMYGIEGAEATKLLTYISGVHDMANAVRREISEMGGK